MFDFEKFPVYINAQDFLFQIQPIFRNKQINWNMRDQLYRASSSILLNIAEGAGKFSKKDKKNFYLIARGSVQECVAIIQLLYIEKNITNESFTNLHDQLSTMGKMLTGLIKSMG